MMNINKKIILKYADAYDKQYKGSDDEAVEIKMKRLLKKQRYFRQKELVKIGRWKSKRPTRHYISKENDDLTVKEITMFSFKTKSEKARIKSLLALKGVSWPVASVILQFAFPTKYPIMDFRVIWSLGWAQPSSYNFSFWQNYCKRIYALSKKYKLPIRAVEKSLWKYSKEHQ
jgi:hypothetical protein